MAVTGRVASPADIHKLQNNKNLSSLPDLSDLMTYNIYKSNFLEGDQYALPKPGETFAKRQYYEEEGKVAVEDEVLVRFDEKWFRDSVKRELGRGIGLLYATLDGPAPIQLVSHPQYGNPAAKLHLATLPLTIASLLLWLLPTLLLPSVNLRKSYKSLRLIRSRAKAA